jgi:cytolysin-activating lysine-acyltransferase
MSALHAENSRPIYPDHLAPADWKAGDRLWLVENVAPFGGTDEIVDDLSETALKEQKLQRLNVGEDSQQTTKAVG